VPFSDSEQTQFSPNSLQRRSSADKYEVDNNPVIETTRNGRASRAESIRISCPLTRRWQALAEHGRDEQCHSP
jgi:hypothetical protein